MSAATVPATLRPVLRSSPAAWIAAGAFPLVLLLILFSGIDFLGQGALWERAHLTLAALAGVAIAWTGWRAATDRPRAVRGWVLAGLGVWALRELVHDVSLLAGAPAPFVPEGYFLIGVGVAASVAYWHAVRGQMGRSEEMALYLDAGTVFLTVATVVLVIFGSAARSPADLPFLGYGVVLLGTLGASVVLDLEVLVERRITGAYAILVGLGLLGVGFLGATGDAAGVRYPPAGGFGPGQILSLGVLVISIGAATWTDVRDEDPRYQRLAHTLRGLLPLASVAFAPLLLVVANVLLPHAAVLVEGSVAVVLVMAVLRQSVLLRERDRAVEREKRLITDLKQSEKRFRSLVQNSSDVVMIVTGEGRIIYQSPAHERVLGHRTADAGGTTVFDLVHPDDRPVLLRLLGELGEVPGAEQSGEYRATHADGSWRRISVTIKNLLHDPAVGGLVLNYQDVTDRRRLEDELKHQAFHDALTGLANRALLNDRIGHALSRRTSTRMPLALLFLDLDDFKTINDGLGHGAGDELLRAVAVRIRSCLRSSDTAARFGGDEFAILLEEDAHMEAAVAAAERILAAFRPPLRVQGRDVALNASIGIVVTAGEVRGVEELTRDADLAMYLAKTNGKGRYQVFEPSMHAAALQRLQDTTDLQHAVEREEFLLHYQPIIDLRSRRLMAVEGLLRWQHPERGLVRPGSFIPLAEQTGSIVPIGLWALRAACDQVRTWQRRYPRHRELAVHVNLSPQQLRQPDLVESISEVLGETDLAASSLVLEITETALLGDGEQIAERLRALKALGITIALDDFGTGYSSLSYLRRFPVDMVKIDRSFVEELRSTSADRGLALAVVQLSETLELTTVAEGIEDAAQLARLREMGCVLGQGYHLGRPLESGVMDAYLGRSAPRAAAVEPDAARAATPSVRGDGRHGVAAREHRRGVRARLSVSTTQRDRAPLDREVVPRRPGIQA